MPVRARLHWFTVPPLAGAALIFALMAWWPPLAGRVASPDGRIFFSTSTHSVATSCDPNGDGMIDGRDASILSLYWKGYPLPEADCNQDGTIDGRDLAIMMAKWNGDVPALSSGAVPADFGPHEAAGPFRIALPATAANGGLPGERFTALVLLDAATSRVGAGEVVVGYDADRVSVRGIRTSPSIWTNWTERPSTPYGPRLVFSGGRPGGFSGTGVLAEIDFETRRAGDPGLFIREESRAFASDATGTPFPHLTATGTALLYEGASPESPKSSRLPEIVRLPAQATPTPVGSGWLVDLSPLESGADIPTYEIEDGDARSVQHSGVYLLGTQAVASHELAVVLHHPDDSFESVSVRLDGLPGGNAFLSNVAKLGFWVAIEIVLAGLLVWLFVRRR